jgi:capsular exopolysaccharide synthesis family protein
MADDSREREADPGEPRTQPVLRMLQIARRHKMLLGLGVVVGLLLGALYYVTTPPVYSSSAQVLVVKKRPDDVVGITGRYQPVEDYVSTHQVLVTSPLILLRAVKKRDLGSLPSFQGSNGKPAAGPDDLASAIKEGLTVTRNKGTAGNNNILELSFRGKGPDDCYIILDAVLESYKDFLDETYRNMSDDTLKLVTDARDGLEKELEKKEAAYRQFREESPLLGNKGGLDAREDSLSALQIKRAGLLMRRAEVQSQLTAVEAAVKAGRSREGVLALIVEFAGKMDAGETGRDRPSPQDQLLPLLAEEKRLLALYGPQHADVRAVRERIEAARDLLTRPSAVYDGKPQEQGGDPVKLHVDYLKEKLNQIDTAEQALNKAFEKEHLELRKLTGYEVRDETFRKEIQRTSQLYDGIIKRLEDVSLAKEAGGYDARTIAAPAVGRKIAPRALTVLPIALFLGVLAGVVLVYLAEITDKSLRSAEDVRRRLGLPLMGYMPIRQALKTGRPGQPETVEEETPGEERTVHPTVVAYHRSASRDAEAFRGVRTALYFSTQGARHKVIQVTSPNPRDGKTTLSSNLAVSIAQSGKKTLLLDADLHRPRVHQLFGLEAPVGLTSVLAGEIELNDAIQDSGIPQLSILPCGPLLTNPAELLTSPRFHDLLGSLGEQYDMVIVDSPPLLAITDPSVIAPRVDGVILVVRLTKHALPAARRAKEILATLDATVFGVVVSGPGGSIYQGYYSYSGYGNYYRDEDQKAEGNGATNDSPRANPSSARPAATPAKERNGADH